MNKSITKIVVFSLMTILAFVSCETTASVSSSNTMDTQNLAYDKAQVIQVQNNDWTNPSSVIPPTAIIQPKDLVTSPVIDITTLKEETERQTQSVRSSTLEQQAQKERILEEYKDNPLVSIELSEDYSDGFLTGNDIENSQEGQTSGQIATAATTDSFVYINSKNAFDGAIANYDYIEGKIYEVITSPKAITDIRLKPGESIAANPIVNDGGTSWQFTMGSSVENGITVQHLFVKPTIVGLDTSMILLTNQRTYYFRIASFPDSYMTALRFRYPTDSGKGYFVDADFDEFIEEANYQTAKKDSFTIDLSKVNYNYKIKKYKGNPAWIPQQVFSDDIRTYIQFPVTMQTSLDLPSVYILRNGTENLVNYRITGNLYQLDAVITANETILLKSGQNEQVKITLL